MSSDTLAPDTAPDEPGRKGERAGRSVGQPPVAEVLGRALFEQSPLSTVVYDPKGHVLQVNPAFQRLWGAGIGDVPADYTVLDDPQLRAAGLLPLVERAFAGESVTTPAVQFEMAAVGGTGQVRWTEAHWYPVRTADGAIAAVVLTHVDLTDRVEAQEKLRLEEERLRIALEAGKAGTWEWVIGDNRVTWSDELQRMHGLQAGEFGGTMEAAQRFRHPDDAMRVAQATQDALETGALRVDYRIVLPDGRTRWVDVRGGVVHDARGRPARMLGICTDATERRRQEEASVFLARASELLHASLEVEATLRTVARLSVPLLGDYCIFDVVQGAEVRRIAVADADAPGAARVAEMEGFPPRLWGDATPVAAVISTGEWYLEPHWNAELSRAKARSPEHVELLAALGIQSVLSVPVAWRGTAYGALTLLFAAGRRHDQADLDLAREVARRAAAAISNARLHAEVRGAREGMEDQAAQLEMQSQQLQEQARELEEQHGELEQQLEEMQLLNEELLSTNDELASANQIAGEARAAAEKAEAFSRGILESISDPFVVHDAEWRFRYLNDAASEVFRLVGRGGAARMVGRVLWDEYPDLEGSRFEREMRRSAAERVPVTFEEFYPGAGRWSELRCYPLPDGGLATVWKDVTDRRRAEEAERYLSRASEILASSLDYEITLGAVAQLLVPQLGDWCAVQLVDADGASAQVAVAHADPARVELARELNRRYPPDTRRDSLVATVLATGRGALVAEIDDAMLAATAQDAEHLRLVRELGLRSALVAPLASGDRVLGTLTIIAAESGRRYAGADLELATELGRRAGMAVENARLYAAAQAARDEAEQANRAKSEFLAVMSHELRTPLNAIGGYAELIEMGVHGAVTDAQRHALDRIQRSQRHLLSLINDVLNYARIEGSRVHYDLADVPVDEMLAGLEALVAPQLAAKELSYACDGCSPRVTVVGDAEKVRQVMLNLLSNAVKFTPAGGHVEVRAQVDEEEVRIAVADTGEGIPRDKLESVFEPFVQLGRGLTSGQEGTGLGLAISRDLARGMGGDLTAESTAGQGSTFTLRLPRGADRGRSEG